MNIIAENEPWTHLFRPRTLDQQPLDPATRKLLVRYAAPAAMANLLFSGPPVAEARRVARLVADKLNVKPIDVDLSGGDVAGTLSDLEEFCSTYPMLGSLKVAIVAGLDRAKHEVRHRLARLVESAAKSSRFILVAATESDVDPELLLRCRPIAIPAPPPAERRPLLERVVQELRIEASDDVVAEYATRHSSWQRMLQAAQQAYWDNGHLLDPPKTHGQIRSVAELRTLPNLNTEIPWDLRPFTATQRLTLLSGAPKLGKTTFALRYAARKAEGGRFLGQALAQGPVLWVGVEEAVEDIVRRLMNDNQPESIFVWPTPRPTIHEIAQTANEIAASLVVLDTLLPIARISAENNNAEWTHWAQEALPLIHDSSAAWLAIHHHRKGGGSHGDAIRGASAIFGEVDVAVSMHRVRNHQYRRRLDLDGTRFDSAQPQIIELWDGEYLNLGEAADTKSSQQVLSGRQQQVLDLLTTEPQTHEEIRERFELAYGKAPRSLHGHLNALVPDHADMEGGGRRGDPRCWRLVETESEPELL